MNAKPSKWETSDNEEEQLIYDDSPPVFEQAKTNVEKTKRLVKDDIDLYCPALPPYLTKKERDHSVEPPKLLSASNFKREACFEASEMKIKAKNESLLSEDVLFIKSEKLQEEIKTFKNLHYSTHYESKDNLSMQDKKNFQYDQIAIITDARYVPYIKHLRRPGVVILSDENLQVTELEKYLPHDLDKSYIRTIFLLVIGIHSVTKQVSSNYCKVASCNRPLQALNSFPDFDRYCADFVKKINAMLSSVKKCLPLHSDIAVLPPLPISLHSNHKNHQVLHAKQLQFPRYVIDNLGDEIAKWYPIWIDKIFRISRSTFSTCNFINLPAIDKLINNTDYKNVQVMACRKGTDKPSYNLWMKVAEDLIESIDCSSKSTISKNIFTECKSNQSTAETNNVNDISILYTENNPKTAIAYDHLVFIGYAASLKLLPDILFTSYSQWHLDDTVAVTNSFSLQISALNSRSFKKVLFVIVSDISMIKTEEKNSECILKHCEESITYIKAPSNPFTLCKNMVKYIASIREIITEMKKYCKFQSKFIVAPFTPRIYVPISSIIFHRNMHDHLQKQTCTRFLRGSTKQIWHEIVEKFEEEWNKFMLDNLGENDDGNTSVKNILSVYSQRSDGSITWKDLFCDLLDSEFSALSLWCSCIISLAAKGWMLLNDCTAFKINTDIQITSESIPQIGKSLSPNMSIDNSNSPKRCEKALEESERQNKKDRYSRTNIYRDDADVLNFTKYILYEIKNDNANNSSTQPMKFKNVFIVGQMEIISPLLDCNVKSLLIAHKFVNYDESDINIIVKKIGKFIENSLCCLVFDIAIITKEFMSSWCIKNACQQPIFGTALKIDNLDPMKELDQLISNQLKKVLKFTRNLSKHVPTVILPLFPTRMYLEEEDSLCHLASHKLLDMGCPIIYGSYSLWDIAIRSLILSWNNLMELTNKSFDSLSYITSYIKSNFKVFVVIDNINDFITHWTEYDVWKAVVETFLLSLVSVRKARCVKSNVAYHPYQDKLCVSVTQIPRIVTSEFFEKIFYIADRNVSITEGKDSFILERITYCRALLLVKKLNSLRIGESFVKATLVGANDEEDFELNLMQKLFISLSIDSIYNKWKPEIINNLAKKIDEVPNMATMKSLPCEKGDSCRGPKVCVYYHSSNDKRRNPFLHQYSDVLCPKPKIDDECEDGIQCNFSHNAYETKFHPSRYQVKVCPSGVLAEVCNSQDLCKFAHEGNLSDCTY